MLLVNAPVLVSDRLKEQSIFDRAPSISLCDVYNVSNVMLTTRTHGDTHEENMNKTFQSRGGSSILPFLTGMCEYEIEGNGSFLRLK